MGKSDKHAYSKVSEAKRSIYMSFWTKEGVTSFATQKYGFWDTDFKLVFKKTGEKPLSLPQILGVMYICNKFWTFSPVNLYLLIGLLD